MRELVSPLADDPMPKVRTPQELNALIPRLTRITQDFLNSLRPFRQEGQTWAHALVRTWQVVETVIKATDNPDKFHAFREAMGKGRYFMGAYGDYAYTDWDPVKAVGWEVVKGDDRRPKFSGINPYIKIIELLTYQPVRMSFREVGIGNGGQHFEQRVILDLLIALQGSLEAEDGAYSACLSFGERRPGNMPSADTRVAQFHHYLQDCSQGQPLSVLARRILK